MDGTACHFEGCRQKFTAVTTDVEKAEHYLGHLDANDKEKITGHCPHDGCEEDLGALDRAGITAHLRTHSTPADSICPHPNCFQDLKDLPDDQILTHLRRHFGVRGRLCPIPGCKFVFPDITDVPRIRAHLDAVHDNNEVQCNICMRVLPDVQDQRTVRAHYQTHFRECQWPGCEHEYAANASDAARRTHLQTHFAGAAPPAPPSVNDRIPPELKKRHPGKLFFCPNCFAQVTNEKGTKFTVRNLLPKPSVKLTSSRNTVISVELKATIG